MRYDSDMQATLNYYEFGMLLQKIDPTLTANDIYTVFARFDASKSGSIEFQEFSNYLNNIQPVGGAFQQQ